jgi:protein involved in polysaccharide export with SLBB domain
MRFVIYCAFLLCLALTSAVPAQTQDRSDTVSIIGEVRKPGQFEVNEPISLSDAIALAGGLAPMAHSRTIEVTHNDTIRIVDFVAMLQGKDPMIYVVRGDTVRVPIFRRR